MEINNHKGKGFVRSKLAKAKSFLRVINSKPSMQGQCSSNKVNPSSPRSPNGSNTSSQNMSSGQPCSVLVQYGSNVGPTLSYTAPKYSSTDFAASQSTQKLSASNQLRRFQDDGGDVNVDMKAASYISYVRERFKLEKVDSEAR